MTGSAGALIATRAVMGVGAAIIFPTTLSIISVVFTDRTERANAIGLWGAVTGLAIALDPTRPAPPTLSRPSRSTGPEPRGRASAACLP